MNFLKKLNLYRRKNKRGFTLVEALLSALLFSILYGACVMVLIAGSNSWQVNNTKIEVQEEVRKAVNWMQGELVQAGVSTITNVPSDGTWYTTITFKTTTGVSSGSITWSSNTITYSLSSNQLIRASGGVNKTIAQNIQTLQFRRQSTTPSLLEITMQGQKTTPKGTVLTASETLGIYLRN